MEIIKTITTCFAKLSELIRNERKVFDEGVFIACHPRVGGDPVALKSLGSRLRGNDSKKCDEAVHRTLLLSILLFGALLLSPQIHAEEEIEWFIDADATAAYDNNVSRAQKRRDIVEEYFATANVSVGANWEIALKQALSGKLFVDGESHQTIKGLGHTDVGGELNYRWQFGLGFGAPFYALIVRGIERKTDFEQRDLSQSSIQLQMSKRFSDHLTMTFGGEYRDEDSDGTVFDTKQSRLFTNADYLIDDNWLTYFTLSYIEGDTTSSAQNRFCNDLPASDVYPIIAASSAVETDEAFNDVLCGNWLAYRLDARTWTGILGMNRTIDHQSSLDLSVLYIHSGATEDDVASINYQRTVWRLSYLVRF